MPSNLLRPPTSALPKSRIRARLVPTLTGLLCSAWVMSCVVPSIRSPDYTGPLREFESGFESQDDFKGFYIVPSGDYQSSHELSTQEVFQGRYSHKAWITAPRAIHNDGPAYLPHRAYPTIQLHKTAEGSFRTPCLITLWVFTDVELQPRDGIDDWLSLVTLSPDASDLWSRTILVNLTTDGYLRLVHVPAQGQQQHLFQAGPSTPPPGDRDLRFPQGQWVRLDVYLDLDPQEGYAKVWQDGALVSHAQVYGGKGGLAQAHFGLYAGAALSAGTVYNDDLSIREVRDEVHAGEIMKF